MRGSKGRRCAVPATGFYEWYSARAASRSTAQPFLVRRKERQGDVVPGIMFMAGLYDEIDKDQGDETAFVIITTGACDEFSWLHDRQPCFLNSQKEIDDWLNVGCVPAEEAVSKVLRTSGGITWRRMMKDLSRESDDQTKPKAQSNITSFFALKGTTAGKPKKATVPSNISPTRKSAKLGVAKSSGNVRKRSIASKTSNITVNRKGDVTKRTDAFFK